MKRIWFIFSCFSLTALLFSCKKADLARTSDEQGGRPEVVVTTTMALDLVSRVAGEGILVKGLMGAGVDPHSYRSKSSDTALLGGAKAIFYNGLHLEGRMQSTLESMKKNGRKVYALTDAIPVELLIAPQEDFPGNHDPHVWGNAELWISCIDEAERGLSEVFPEEKEGFVKRAAELRTSFKELNEWARKRVAEVSPENRYLITSHDAFFYFGKAYGFQVGALQGLSTVSEAGLNDRKELVDLIRQRSLKTIFPETSVNKKGISEIAREAGCQISDKHLFSDAMGERGEMESSNDETYDLGTYEGMLKHNINAIVDGLK